MDSDDDFYGFQDDDLDFSGYGGGDELDFVMERSARKLGKTKHSIHFVITPEGDESEVDDLDSDDGDEVDMLLAEDPLSNVEVIDYSSEDEESDAPPVQKIKQTRRVQRLPSGLNAKRVHSTSKTQARRAHQRAPSDRVLQRACSGRVLKRTRKGRGPPRARGNPTQKSVPTWRALDDCSEPDPPVCEITFSLPPKKELTPYMYFSKYIDTQIIDHIAVESQRYAEQQGSADTTITRADIEKFLGVILLMGIVKTRGSTLLMYANICRF